MTDETPKYAGLRDGEMLPDSGALPSFVRWMAMMIMIITGLVWWMV
jgi:hypothetical protein